GWAAEQLTAGPAASDHYQAFLTQAEAPLFETVLHTTLGNHSAAADILGIHRATLRKKLGGRAEDSPPGQLSTSTPSTCSDPGAQQHKNTNVSSPVLTIWWTWPGGIAMASPGPTSVVSASIRMRPVPRRM